MPERPEGKPRRLPQVSLGELARARWTLRVTCPRCLHSAVLSASALMLWHGWNRQVRDLGWRCTRCGSKGGQPDVSVELPD